MGKGLALDVKHDFPAIMKPCQDDRRSEFLSLGWKCWIKIPVFRVRRSAVFVIGAALFEQNDKWQTSSRYVIVEALAQIDQKEIGPNLSIMTKPAWS